MVGFWHFQLTIKPLTGRILSIEVVETPPQVPLQQRKALRGSGRGRAGAIRSCGCEDERRAEQRAGGFGGEVQVVREADGALTEEVDQERQSNRNDRQRNGGCPLTRRDLGPGDDEGSVLGRVAEQ